MGNMYISRKKDKKKKEGPKQQKKFGPRAMPVIYKSEYLKQTLEATWKQFELEVAVCGGMDSPISIEVYDYDKDGTHGNSIVLFIRFTPIIQISLERPRLP